MVRLALKRLVHNRSLSAALLLAAVLCVAAVASVPIYTRGVLQKLLRADLERLQHTGATFPGRIHAELDFPTRPTAARVSLGTKPSMRRSSGWQATWDCPC